MSAVARDWIDEIVNLDKDPRTAQWWSTGITVLPSALLAYTAVTTVLPLAAYGKTDTRLPWLRFFKMVHNAVSAVLNLIVGALLYRAYRSSDRSFVCQDRIFDDNSESQTLLTLMWFMFVLKFSSMLDAFILLLSHRETRVKNATVLNGYLSVIYVWFFLRYGSDGHGVPSVIAFCAVDAVTHLYYLLSQMGPAVMSAIRPHRIQITRLQMLGIGVAWAHYFVSLIAECRFPAILALVGFSYAGLRFVRLFDFYTEKFILNGVRLGLDWTIIAGILENCCFAQGNPNGQHDDDDDEYEGTHKTAASTFRNGFSGPVKPKSG